MSGTDEVAGQEPLEPIDVDLQAEADAILAGIEPAGGDAPGQDAGVSSGPDVETAELVSQLLDVTFNRLLTKRGPHWQLSKTECRTLGAAYGAVLDKYFPGLNLGCEVTAVVVTLAIIGPRLATDRALAAQADDAPSAPSAPPRPVVVGGAEFTTAGGDDE